MSSFRAEMENLGQLDLNSQEAPQSAVQDFCSSTGNEKTSPIPSTEQEPTHFTDLVMTSAAMTMILAGYSLRDRSKFSVKDHTKRVSNAALYLRLAQFGGYDNIAIMGSSLIRLSLGRWTK